LKPGEVADTIITVGDPDRVKKVAAYLDEIELTKQNREFLTITGRLGKQRISIISTGIGTDNVDIVFNELDALFNIDFNSHKIKKAFTQLKFIRIGTTGTIQKDIEIDSFILSKHAIGTDGLANFYPNHQNENKLLQSFNKIAPSLSGLYTSTSDDNLSLSFQSFCKSGITITCPGFYAPQGRQLRLSSNINFVNDTIVDFRFDNLSITNLEMETAGIYALSKLLGHQAVSLNVALANRNTGMFSQNPEKSTNQLIQKSLDVISNGI
jgi:uridine phosphorylase